MLLNQLKNIELESIHKFAIEVNTGTNRLILMSICKVGLCIFQWFLSFLQHERLAKSRAPSERLPEKEAASRQVSRSQSDAAHIRSVFLYLNKPNTNLRQAHFDAISGIFCDAS